MKNFIWFIVFVVIVICGAGYFYFSFYDNSLGAAEQLARDKVNMVSRAVSMEQTNLFTEVGRDLELIATMFKGEKDISNKKFNDIYNKYFSKDSYLTSLGFMNSAGTLVAIAPKKFEKEIGNNYAFRKYFQNAKTTKDIVYSGLIDNYRPKKIEDEYKTILLALPVHYNEKFYGVFFTQIDTDKIEENLKEIMGAFEAKSSDLYFYDIENDKVVARTGMRFEENPDFEEFLKKVCQEQKLLNKKDKVYTFNNEKYFIDIQPIVGKHKKAAFELIGVFLYDDLIGYFAKFNREVIYLVVFIVAIITIVLIGVVYNEKVIKRLNVKIERLEISINEVAKKKEVSELTETTYFKDLRDKIDSIQKSQDKVLKKKKS